MKKQNKIFLIISIIVLCIFILVKWLLDYKWNYAPYGTDNYQNEKSTLIGYSNIRNYQDKKIIFNCTINSGAYKVYFYKIPENHAVMQFLNADIEEVSKLYAAGLKMPTTTDGMELIESYEYSADGEYAVDTSDWELGVYAMKFVGDEQTSASIKIGYRYKCYNWQRAKIWIMSLFGSEAEEAAREEISPY